MEEFSYLKHKFFTILNLAFCTFILITISQFQGNVASLNAIEAALPALQILPLPPTLTKWQIQAESGDYFDQVKPPEFGHLVWSQFPIKVFVERVAEGNRSESWVKAVLDAVLEWGVYLPLQVVDEAEIADIKILHKSPLCNKDKCDRVLVKLVMSYM